MRKIEQLMNVAISNNNEYWSKANTSVETIDGVSYVRLHGNLIAEVDDNGIKLYDGGWQSNTTKSRLNAIINTLCDGRHQGVFQRDFDWYIQDDEIDGAKFTIPFQHGYTFARVN